MEAEKDSEGVGDAVDDAVQPGLPVVETDKTNPVDAVLDRLQGIVDILGGHVSKLTAEGAPVEKASELADGEEGSDEDKSPINGPWTHRKVW